MKILHSGDLHLGKTLHEMSLLDDQKHMLNQLHLTIEKGDYAALILAGDIYDRTVPPSDAVELFSSFLTKIRKTKPSTEIFIIPGNHDSPQRLGFAQSLLQNQGIHIISNPEKSFEPIILTKNNEKLALYLLPFLAPGALKSTKDTNKKEFSIEQELNFTSDENDSNEKLLYTQQDLLLEASKRFSATIKDIPSVLVAHLFTLSGLDSASERLFLGTAEKINPQIFDFFTYIALGHLHKSQKITERMYYAGSPLAYSFDESGFEKNFLDVDIDCTTKPWPIQVKKIPVKPLHRVIRLQGKFNEFYSSNSFNEYSEDYLEIQLLDQDLINNPINLLRQKFPYILSIKQGFFEQNTSELREISIKLEENRDPISDFNQFQQDLYQTIDEEKTKLFKELLMEFQNET